MDRSSCFNCYPLTKRNNFCLLVSPESKKLFELLIVTNYLYVIDDIRKHTDNSKNTIFWKVIGYITGVSPDLTFEDIEDKFKLDPCIKELEINPERQEPYFMKWKSPGYFTNNPGLIEFKFKIYLNKELEEKLETAKKVIDLQNSVTAW
jgi:hypothetical protein